MNNYGVYQGHAFAWDLSRGHFSLDHQDQDHIYANDSFKMYFTFLFDQDIFKSLTNPLRFDPKENV